MEHMAEDYEDTIDRLINSTLTKKEEEEKEPTKTSDNIFSNLKKFKHEEYQYLNLLENILENGFWEEGRNGKTKSIFGTSMRFSLKDNKIPILTTKKTAWKTCLKELLWFIRGETDNKILKEQGVHIWDANASRDFLDSRGLHLYPEDIIGPCFVKGTKVLTYNGYKNIEDISKDETIYTHKGNFCPVVENMERSYSGQLYKIRPKYSPYDIVCTPEHPFYARKFIVKNGFKVDGIEKRNVIFPDEPTFVQAKDLVKGDYFLGMKIEEKEIIPEFVLNGNMNSLDNPNFWWMMGLFVGNGWLLPRQSRIYFLIYNNQINEYLPKLKTLMPCFKHEKDQKGCKVYYCDDDEITNILKLFGKCSTDKIIPNFVHEAPKNLIREFLNGYIDSNNNKSLFCFSESYKIRRTNVSHNVAFSLQRLYLKLGSFISIRLGKPEEQKPILSHDIEKKANETYFFEVHTNSKSDYSFIENGYAWFTIKNIEIENAVNTNVYNLSVIDDNSYIVNNIAVHNCYGYQWRTFNANYNCFTGKRLLDNDPHDVHKETKAFKGVDQLQQIIDTLKNPKERTSRRLVMTAWNPAQIDKMALPPCHILCQFNVHDGDKLSCALYQRSGDFPLGIPFNIASYSFLTHLLAKHCGLQAYEFVHFIGNAHIYEDHIEPMKQQIHREPFDFPTIYINELRENINDYQVEDFEVQNYLHHEQIKMKMVV